MTHLECGSIDYSGGWPTLTSHLRSMARALPASSSWKCVRSKPNRVFSRPLGMTECGFYWDSQLDGTADTLRMIAIEACDTSVRIDEEVVGAAWLQMKQHFPLLAASVSELPDGWVQFEVDEDRLAQHHSLEITFLPAASATEADAISDDLLYHKGFENRQLSNDHLCRLYVMQDSQNQNTFYIVFLVSHMITDGIAHASILRNFLNLLSSDIHSVNPGSLEERLASCVASENLVPSSGLPIARQRWRKAIASIILKNRRKSFIGGHTLPRRWTAASPFIAGRSYHTSVTFPVSTSSRFIASCRSNGQTFGSAYPVIGQLALTRLLARQYALGNINQDEWEFRLRERMYTAGPINLRPYLDQDWLKEKRGHESVCLSIAFGFYALPRMPVPRSLRPGDPAPGFDQLLSKSQFFARCSMVKQQVKDYMKHPLFVEMAASITPARVPRMKNVVERWRQGEPDNANEKQLTVQEQAAQGLVTGHGGSSLGNLDFLVPLHYPVEGKPKIILHSTKHRLHCRPNEFYLGAKTSKGELCMFVYVDQNIYDKDMIDEWLQKDVKDAVEYYLG